MGEELLLILDKLDDMVKPDLVGRLFKAFVSGAIDHAEFRLMAAAIDRLTATQLGALVSFYNDDKLPAEETLQAFAFVGVARIVTKSRGPEYILENVGVDLAYDRNERGRRLVALLVQQQ